MTYDEAQAQLTGRCKDRRKLANNTYLIRRGDDIAIRLHETDIVTLHPDYTVTLDSGTWQTVTTKARINDYAPGTRWKIWQEKGIWYMADGSLFYDGMRLDPSGHPIEPRQPADHESKMKQIKKDARKYARAYVEALKAGTIDYPNGGDCWHCLMFDKRERNDRSEYPSAEHIRNHIEEEYFVPSLLVNAAHDAGYQDMQVGLMGIGGQRVFIDPENNLYKYIVKRLAKEL